MMLQRAGMVGVVLLTLVGLVRGAEFRVSNATATANLLWTDATSWADGVVPCDKAGSNVDISLLGGLNPRISVPYSVSACKGIANIGVGAIDAFTSFGTLYLDSSGGSVRLQAQSMQFVAGWITLLTSEEFAERTLSIAVAGRLSVNSFTGPTMQPYVAFTRMTAIGTLSADIIDVTGQDGIGASFTMQSVNLTAATSVTLHSHADVRFIGHAHISAPLIELDSSSTLRLFYSVSMECAHLVGGTLAASSGAELLILQPILIEDSSIEGEADGTSGVQIETLHRIHVGGRVTIAYAVIERIQRGWQADNGDDTNALPMLVVQSDAHLHLNQGILLQSPFASLVLAMPGSNITLGHSAHVQFGHGAVMLDRMASFTFSSKAVLLLQSGANLTLRMVPTLRWYGDEPTTVDTPRIVVNSNAIMRLVDYADSFVSEASLLLEGGTFNATLRPGVTLDFRAGIYLVDQHAISPLFYAPGSHVTSPRTFVFGAGQMIFGQLTTDSLEMADGSRVNGTVQVRQMLTSGQYTPLPVLVGGDLLIADGAVVVWALPVSSDLFTIDGALIVGRNCNLTVGKVAATEHERVTLMRFRKPMQGEFAVASLPDQWALQQGQVDYSDGTFFVLQMVLNVTRMTPITNTVNTPASATLSPRDLGLVLGLSVAGGILTAVGIVVGMLLWRLKRVRDRRRFVLPMDGDAIVHSGVEADPLLLGDE